MTGENNFPVEDTVRECAQLLFVRRGWIWVIGIIVFLYGAAAAVSGLFRAATDTPFALFGSVSGIVVGALSLWTGWLLCAAAHALPGKESVCAPKEFKLAILGLREAITFAGITILVQVLAPIALYLWVEAF